MKRTRFLLALLAALAFGCTKQQIAEPVLEISFDSERLEFPIGGGDIKMKITANNAWQVDKETQSSWLTVTPSSGGASSGPQEVVLHAEPNESTIAPEAKITVRSKNLKRDFTFTQAAAVVSYGFDVTPSELNPEATQTAATFSVTITPVNKDDEIGWTAEVLDSPEGVSLSKYEGVGNGHPDEITVTLPENETVSEHIYVVRISIDNADGEDYRDVKITHKCGQYKRFEVSSVNVPVSASATSGSFEVIADEDIVWTAALAEDRTGVTVSQSAEKGNGTVTVTFPENTSEAGKQYEVVVSSDGFVEHHELNVVVAQSANNPELTLSGDGVTVKGFETEASFDVISNTNWTLTLPEGVESADGLTGSGNQTVRLTFPQNEDTGNGRTYTVTVSADGVESKTFTITQGRNFYVECDQLSYVDIPYGGTVLKVALRSNADWTIDLAESGVECAVLNGNGDAEVTLTVPENIVTKELTRTLYIGTADNPHMCTITIMQNAAAPFFVIEGIGAGEYKHIAFDATSATVNIHSNVTWTVEDNNTGIEGFAVVSPEGEVTGDGTVQLRFPVNTSISETKYFVKFTHSDLQVNKQPYSFLTVAQAGVPYLSVKKYEETVSADEEYVSINVDTNTGWTAHTEDDGITLDQTEGHGSAYIRATFGKNQSKTQERHFTVTVERKDGIGTPQTVKITQQKKTDRVSVSGADFGRKLNANETEISFYISVNCNWTLEASPADGVTFSRSSGGPNDGGEITMTFPENTTSAERLYRVTILSEGRTTMDFKEFTQLSAANSTLVIDRKDITVSANTTSVKIGARTYSAPENYVYAEKYEGDILNINPGMREWGGDFTVTLPVNDTGSPKKYVVKIWTKIVSGEFVTITQNAE